MFTPWDLLALTHLFRMCVCTNYEICSYFSFYMSLGKVVVPLQKLALSFFSILSSLESYVARIRRSLIWHVLLLHKGCGTGCPECVQSRNSCLLNEWGSPKQISVWCIFIRFLFFRSIVRSWCVKWWIIDRNNGWSENPHPTKTSSVDRQQQLYA